MACPHGIIIIIKNNCLQPRNLKTMPPIHSPVIYLCLE